MYLLSTTNQQKDKHTRPIRIRAVQPSTTVSSNFTKKQTTSHTIPTQCGSAVPITTTTQTRNNINKKEKKKKEINHARRWSWVRPYWGRGHSCPGTSGEGRPPGPPTSSLRFDRTIANPLTLTTSDRGEIRDREATFETAKNRCSRDEAEKWRRRGRWRWSWGRKDATRVYTAPSTPSRKGPLYKMSNVPLLML